MYYILNKNKKIKEVDATKWHRWFKNSNRRVDETVVGWLRKVRISTVFLGIDHRFGWGASSRPILFETMVFGGEYDLHQQRYSTWDEAAQGHQEVVKMVRSSKLFGL